MSEQDPNEQSSLEEQWRDEDYSHLDPEDRTRLEAVRAELLQIELNIKKIGVLNVEIKRLYRLRDESRQRLAKFRRDHGLDGRFHDPEQRRDPSPVVSNLSNSAPSLLSSNESSVDVYTVAEHKRPVTIPRKPAKKHRQDKVEPVGDLSDREDDPSTEIVSGEEPDEEAVAQQAGDGDERSESGLFVSEGSNKEGNDGEAGDQEAGDRDERSESGLFVSEAASKEGGEGEDEQ